MKVGKPKSKRTPVRLRHKIEKASASKQRKLKKEAKTNPQWRSRLKKDPGIPNMFPFKAQLLAEIEEGKRRKAEEQMAKREMAKARRLGVTADAAPEQMDAESENEADDGGVTVLGPDEQEGGMDVDDENPMAALLASAQARANTYDHDENEDDEDESAQEDTWNGVDGGNKTATAEHSTKKTLPKRALEDPIKAITLVISKTGTQHITDYYQLPALVTSASDISTRLLVEVARKRGRLGRGGVPNLHAAALVILNDINDERLVLPAELAGEAKKASTGNVKIVKTMSAPFRLDGLWGDKGNGSQAMAIDG